MGENRACSSAWGDFDSSYTTTGAPLDLLRFVEKDGKMGISYPAAGVLAWKV